eukprot:SAG22_NODE_792_length_7198_cov_1.752641_2_plen_449_part_00
MRRTSQLLVLAVVPAVMLAAAPVAGSAAGGSMAGSKSVVSNIAPRLDSNGSIMDAHDGNTVQFGRGEPYYWYAMGYGKCIEDGRAANQTHGCGLRSNNTVGIWSSATLASGSWKLERMMRPSDGASGWPKCTYFRVHTVYNRRTATYMMWINAERGRDSNCTACDAVTAGGSHCYLAGTASSPAGPFEYAGPVGVKYSDEGGVGDFSLFVDGDDEGYVIYKRTGAAPFPYGHSMTLQQLSPDYLGVLPEASVGMAAFTTPFVEAPAMFERQGTYYALFGKCCAFCAQGSGIGVWSAPKPLGPWSVRGNIGCSGGPLPADCGCGMPPPTHFMPSNASAAGCAAAVAKSKAHSVSHAQQNSVITVRSSAAGAADAVDGLTYVWTGDRWQSSFRQVPREQGFSGERLGPDLGCVKAYDYQYWAPLQWDDTSSPPVPKQLVWQDTIELSVVL